MRNLIRQITTFTVSHLSLWLGAALSAAVGIALYLAAASIVDKDAAERFVSYVHTAHYTVLGRVKSYTDLMRGTASMLQTSPNLTQEQFHRYVEGLHLQAEFPGIETINYARFFTDAERDAFEKRMRTELRMENGYPDFRITPPGRRDEYMTLTFIEPVTAWTARVGFDLLTNPNIRAVILKSRDSGGVSSSGLPIPMRKAITGLGMRLPIYRSDAPLNTVEQRRAAFLGSVGIGFSVERLMDGVLSQLPVDGMRAKLVGVVPGSTPGSAERRILLYDSLRGTARARARADANKDQYYVSLPIDYNQRVWEAQFSIEKSAMLSGLDAYTPWFALGAGCVSTALLYALFHILASSRRHAIALADEMTKELRDSEANLQLSNTKLRRLAAHAEQIKENERKRIAREIHDDLGQNLLALRIEAQLLASRTSARQPLLHERASGALSQIDSIVKSVRQIINDLRPTVLDLGLNAAVDWQIEQFQRRTGIPCELIENDQDIQVSDRCATALFRILQESLTNISRHASATRVRVELRVTPAAIEMTISDNGVGLRARGRHSPGSFGLVGIEERVTILGGSCLIGAGAQGGTTIHVSVPLAGAPRLPEAEESRLDDQPFDALV